jgi:predicted kinase
LPVALLLTGESGSGKTTVAGHLAAFFDFVYVSNEELRSSVLPSSRFTPEEDSSFFSALDRVALHFLSQGRSVLWDARFPRRSLREEKRQFFAAHGYVSAFLCVYTLEYLRIERLAEREIRRPAFLSSDAPCYTKTMIATSKARSCRYETVADDEPDTFRLANIRSPLDELLAFMSWLQQRLASAAETSLPSRKTQGVTSACS